MVLDGRCEYSLESDIYYEYDLEIELVVGSSDIIIFVFQLSTLSWCVLMASLVHVYVKKDVVGVVSCEQEFFIFCDVVKVLISLNLLSMTRTCWSQKKNEKFRTTCPSTYSYILFYDSPWND
jgi:hypothetical protein